MERGEALTVTLVDDEGSFFGIKELFDCVVPSIPSCEVQWALVLVVFQINASTKTYETLQRANVPLSACVMQW